MSTTLQPLPNPFLDSQASPRPARPSRFTLQPALVAFLICLALGLVMVAWRTKTRVDDARARARLEALAQSSALELQFNQVVSAAELLGILARQQGGAIPEFQKVAGEMLSARPGLASLELQPGGVVSDIAPRAANARAIGLNVLKNPTYHTSASTAIQRRALTLTGPVALYSGEPGIIARVPIFVRGRDGREACWGFVAASMRLSDALARARVDDLTRSGYNYVFSAPPSGHQKGLTIKGFGTLSAQGAVQQPVRAQELEFQLALQPRGGWISKTKLALESLAALVASGLVCLLVNLLESHRAVEAALAGTNQRLARETEDRTKAQADCRGAKDEAAAAQAELTRLRAALQSSNEQEVRLSISVRAAEAAAQAAQAELDQASAARQQAEQMIASLQSRLRAASRGEKKIQAIPLPPPQEEQPPAANAPTATHATTSSAEQSSESSLGSITQVEEAHQELSSPPEVDAAAASIPEPAPEPEQSSRISPEPESSAPLTPPEPPPTTAVLSPEPTADKKPANSVKRKRARRDNKLDATTPPAEQSVDSSLGSITQVEEAYQELSSPPEVDAAAASIPEPSPEAVPASATNPEPESSAPPTPPEPPPKPEVLSPEPPAEKKPSKPPRRKKALHSNQLDFFAAPLAAEPASTTRAASPLAEEPSSEEPAPPPAEVLPSSATSVASETEKPTAETSDHPPVEPKPKEAKPARPLPARPPLDLAQVRKAVNLILPLFTGRDPGARDCLKDNRTTFRSAFAPEAYAEFEDSVKSGDFDAALEHLKKAAKRHGIPV